jgi:hypothetical protein
VSFGESGFYPRIENMADVVNMAKQLATMGQPMKIGLVGINIFRPTV